MSENLYYFKTKHIPLSKNAGSTVPNGTKNTRKYPKFRQLPLLVVYKRPIAWCVRNCWKYMQKKWIWL